jgi:dTDP-glucose 4,6-dehydratase
MSSPKQPERFDNARLLVSGGAGFIGSNLVRMLLAHGAHVLNLDRLSYAGNLASLADVASSPNYRFAQIDLANAEALDHALQNFAPTAVIHLAAESHVDRSIDGPRAFIDANIVGTYNLLQSSLRYFRSLDRTADDRIHNLHVTPHQLFGSLSATGRFTESTAYNPTTPYAATKAGSDHLVRAWRHTYGLPTIVTNCSNNYGPYQFPEKLIPVVIIAAVTGQPNPVYGAGENVRDWLHVEDHCRALGTVLAHGAPGETYAIGAANERRNIDLVRQLCTILDDLAPRDDRRPHADQITFVPDRPGHDFRYAIDSTKIRRELGWQPEIASDAGLRSTVAWYLDQRDWWQTILGGDYRLPRQGLPQ